MDRAFPLDLSQGTGGDARYAYKKVGESRFTSSRAVPVVVAFLNALHEMNR